MANGFTKPTTNEIIDQWFSFDSSFDIAMQKELIHADQEIQQFSLSFISDDHQQVHGTLTIPRQHSGQLSLALLLHAMGSDQQLWWQDNKIHGHEISKNLLNKGYAIVTLDARRHGQRKIDQLTPRDMINKAHSSEPRLYTDMIIGTVRDYRLVLNWLKKQDPFVDNVKTLAAGYSMGAQMALILASYESSINKVIAMVPPYVKAINSPVAPRLHAEKITEAQVLFLAAKKDPYSSSQQTQLVFDHITSKNKTLQWFNSGHLLPSDYYLSVLSFINDQKVQPKTQSKSHHKIQHKSQISNQGKHS